MSAAGFEFLPDIFRAREQHELAEEKLGNAKSKLHRLRTSHQAPSDPVILKKAIEQVGVAERELNRAKTHLARFGIRP